MKRTLLLILLAALLFGCCTKPPASGVRLQWGTTGIKAPVALPVSGDMLSTPISIYTLQGTKAGMLIDRTSGRARTRVKSDGEGNISIESACLPDTVIHEVEVQVPVIERIEAECPPTDKGLLKAKRSQGRTEGALGIIIILLLIFVGRLLLKGAIPFSGLINKLR